MVSLVDQTVEVYLGGLYMFPDLVPPAVDLYKENTTSWDVRFGILNMNKSRDCSTCKHFCNSCGYVPWPPENDAHAIYQHSELCVSVDQTQLTSEQFNSNSNSMSLGLCQLFSYSTHSCLFLFQKYLKLDFSAFHCNECVVMQQLLYAALKKKIQKLQWV